KYCLNNRVHLHELREINHADRYFHDLVERRACSLEYGLRFSQAWRVSGVMPPTASLRCAGRCRPVWTQRPTRPACLPARVARGLVELCRCAHLLGHAPLSITGAPASVEVPPRLSARRSYHHA